MMNLKLTVTAAPPDSSLSGQSFDISAAGATIGRGSANTCLLPDNERIVSSKHAAIRYELGQFVITDTSTNGTYLNNNPAPLGPNNGASLNEGDTIAIGKYVFSVSLSAAQSEPVQPAAASPASFLDSLSPSADVPPSEPATASDDDFDKWLEPQQPSSAPDPLWGASNLVHSPLPSEQSEENDPLAAIEQAQSIDNPLDLPVADEDPDWWKNSQKDDVAPLQQAFTPPPVQSVESNDLFSAPENVEPIKEEPVREDTNPGDSRFGLDAVADVDDAGDLDALLGLSDSGSVSSEPAPFEPFPEPIPESISGPAPEPIPDTPDPAATGMIPSIEKTEPPPHPEVMAVNEAAPEPQKPEPNVAQPVVAADTAQILASLLELGSLDEAQLQNLTPEVASVLRETVNRLLEMLRVRSSIKNELRLDRTMIQPVENNPLKFSLTEKDALRYLFGEHSGAYMSGTRAVREAFGDIEDHQVALLSGMRSAYEKMLAKFSPEALEKRFADAAAKGLLTSKKSRLWDAYEEYFDKLRHDPETSFNRLFGEEFASAYEEQIDSLKASKRDRDN